VDEVLKGRREYFENDKASITWTHFFRC
jgi:hypothetical protein